VTILGHIQACPTRFLAQKTFFILKKGGQKKSFSWPSQLVYIKRGTNHGTRHAGNKRSQGSLDRRRREKLIWKMFTESDCYPFTDLEGES